jgi:hypothetical protein
VKYFNISYVVLIVVPLIATSFETANEKFGYGFTMPPMVKDLYFASIAYAIAIAIYQYRCPAIIKEYINAEDYLEKNLEQFKGIAPDLKFYIVLAHLNKNTQSESFNEVVELFANQEAEADPVRKTELKVLLDQKLNEVYPGSVQAHLLKRYVNENKKDSAWCRLSGLFYLIGTSIVTWLLIIRTVIVFNS